MLGTSVQISSACRKPPAYMLFTDAPIERACSCLRSGSIMSRNRAGDKADPCLTPHPRAKGGETCCPRRTELRPSEYQLLSKHHVLEFIPAWNSLFRSTENSMPSPSRKDTCISFLLPANTGLSLFVWQIWHLHRIHVSCRQTG